MRIVNLNDDPGQLLQLASWHQEEWSYLNPGESIEQRIARMQPFLNNQLLPSTYIALEDNLTGSAALVSHDMETRPDLSPWLASVYVAAEFRGRGIGTKLVKHVMQQAFKGGINKLYLYTPDKENFYSRLGWKTLSREKYHAIDVTIMEINLNALFSRAEY